MLLKFSEIEGPCCDMKLLGRLAAHQHFFFFPLSNDCYIEWYLTLSTSPWSNPVCFAYTLSALSNFLSISISTYIYGCNLSFWGWNIEKLADLCEVRLLCTPSLPPNLYSVILLVFVNLNPSLFTLTPC